MRKFTLFLVALFLSVGTMAQNPILEYTNIDLSNGPFELSAKDAQLIVSKDEITVIIEADITNTSNSSVALGVIKNYEGTMNVEDDILALGVGNNQLRYYIGNASGQYFSRGSINTGKCCLAYTLSTSVAEKMFVNRTQVEPDKNTEISRTFKNFSGVNYKFFIGGIKNSSETWGTFNGTIYSVKVYEGVLSAETMLAMFQAEQSVAKQFVNSFEGKVGYPNETAINAYKASIDGSVIAEQFEAHKATLISSTDINMPVDGKAYTFKNVQKNGKTFYFKYAESGITLSENEDDAEVFVCRVKNGKYVFVNNAGKYFTHKGGGNYTGPNGNKGYTNAYDQTEGKYLNDFGIVKLTNGGSVSFSKDFLFGYVAMYTRRNDRNEDVYYVLKNDKGFDQASAPFGNDNFSSMIAIEEAEYPNVLNMNLVVGDLVNINGTIATFSAPFATVAPEGVKAYYAAENAGNYITLAEVNGAIPANQGVIIVGSKDIAGVGTVVMKPATDETVASIENNLLGHSAGAAKDMTGVSNAYILALQPEGIGFYECSGGTLAQNKSYLQLDAASYAVGVRLPGTTGVEKVEVENTVNVIYDLTGRRVEAITAPGIYIVGGKKVLVK